MAVARVLARQPKTAILRMDANKNEYFTRHLVDGRIVYCDHRVSVVTGYLAEEVYGESAFAFMHTDDYKWPITLLCRSKLYHSILFLFFFFFSSFFLLFLCIKNQSSDRYQIFTVYDSSETLGSIIMLQTTFENWSIHIFTHSRAVRV